MASTLAELRAQIIAASRSPMLAQGKCTFGKVLTADEVGYGRPTRDQFIAEGDRIHTEAEARYGAGSEDRA